jgi:putative addiction module component (TIGR02574 family)
MIHPRRLRDEGLDPMPTDLVVLQQQIRELSVSDKLELVRTLIAELDGSPDPDVEAAWLIEAQRRNEELRRGDVKGIPAEHVFGQARSRSMRLA